MRSYGVRAWVLYQDASQITSAYEKYWPTILNNVSTLQILSANTYLAAKGIAALTGDSLHPQQILELPNDQQLLLTTGGKLERSAKLDYLVDPLFAGSYDLNPMYASSVSMVRSVTKMSDVRR